jgi:hypothetical protein
LICNPLFVAFVCICVCVVILQDAEDKLRHDLVQTKGKLEETVIELTTATSSYEQRILELNLAADAVKRQKESAIEKLKEVEIAKNEESKLKEQVMNQLKAASETLEGGQAEFQATKVPILFLYFLLLVLESMFSPRICFFATLTLTLTLTL